MVCLQVCQLVCSTAYSLYLGPLRDSSLAYQAVHLVMSAIRDKLQWLSYPQRVTFKLYLTTYKCLHGLAPPYLTRFCTPLSAVAGRTADQPKLFVPRTSTSTFGSRAFSSSSPLSWNALRPQLLDPAISISIFRQSLKTHLFNNNSD